MEQVQSQVYDYALLSIIGEKCGYPHAHFSKLAQNLYSLAFFIFFYFCSLQCTEIVKTAIIIAYFRHFLCIDIKVMREFKTVKLAYICSIRRCNIMRLPRLSSFSLSHTQLLRFFYFFYFFIFLLQ